MARRLVITALVFAALAPVPGSSPAAARPYPDTFCDGSVQARGQQWGFDGRAVGCDFQRRWTRRWLRHGEHPTGWECFGVVETGDCHKRHSHHPRLWFEFYVLD